jgi:hypothetical protein
MPRLFVATRVYPRINTYTTSKTLRQEMTLVAYACPRHWEAAEDELYSYGAEVQSVAKLLPSPPYGFKCCRMDINGIQCPTKGRIKVVASKLKADAVKRFFVNDQAGKDSDPYSESLSDSFPHQNGGKDQETS